MMHLLGSVAQAEPTQSANPYLVAGFALAGVLLGAIVSALTQVVVASRQRTFTQQQALRDERRVVYARFLAEVENADQIFSRYRGLPPVDSMRPTHDEADEAMRRLWGTETQVALIAGWMVRQLAFGVVSHEVDVSVAALGGEPEPAGLPPERNGSALRRAMRAELGIESERPK